LGLGFPPTPNLRGNVKIIYQQRADDAAETVEVRTEDAAKADKARRKEVTVTDISGNERLR